MLRSLSDLFAQSTLRRSPPEYPPHVANAKIAKSCQKQTTFLFYFVSATTTSRSTQQLFLQHRPPRLRFSITPCIQSIATHYSSTLPNSRYKEPQNLKLCCHTQTETSPFVSARHLSPPLLSQTPFGIHNLGSYLNLTGKLRQERRMNIH